MEVELGMIPRPIQHNAARHSGDTAFTLIGAGILLFMLSAVFESSLTFVFASTTILCGFVTLIDSGLKYSSGNADIAFWIECRGISSVSFSPIRRFSGLLDDEVPVYGKLHKTDNGSFRATYTKPE